MTNGEQYGLVFDQTEPLWMIPWLGGFGGHVFADDGFTPTLDTPEMVNALQFLQDIKYTTPIIPMESNYATADTLFREGKAAMIINGDWSLNGYRDTLGENVGVAPIPQVSETGEWPASYILGTYFMIPANVDNEKMDVVIDFIEYATNEENQIVMFNTFSLLPGLRSALNDPAITMDEIYSGSAEQMTYGIAMPVNFEMRCVWDAIKPEYNAVMTDTIQPFAAAGNMQASAEACIRIFK